MPHATGIKGKMRMTESCSLRRLNSREEKRDISTLINKIISGINKCEEKDKSG